MIKKRLYQIFAACLLIASTGAYAATDGLNLTITRIASTFKSDPNAFSGLTPPAYNSGYYAFIGSGHGAVDLGIFANPQGHMQVITSNESSIPNSSGTFSTFGGSKKDQQHRLLDVDHQGNILFFGEGTFKQQGLYLFKEGKIHLVANSDTPIPKDSGNFLSFAYPSLLADGSIGFWGDSAEEAQGVYLANSHGLLSKLISTEDKIPLGTGYFTQLSNVSFSTLSTSKTPEFAFIGKGIQKQLGLYLYTHGKVRLIANEHTNLPSGGTGYFTHFAKVSLDANTGGVAYIAGGLLGQNGIYYFNGQNSVMVADINSFIPEGIGRFLHFSQVDASHDLIAFQASGQQNQQGVYLYSSDGNIFKIINNKDKIDGRTVKSVMMSGDSLQGNNLALLVNFTDNSQAIYVITLGVAVNN